MGHNFPSDSLFLKKLLKYQIKHQGPEVTLFSLQQSFRNFLKKTHNINKMVGVFSPFEALIPTVDRGTIKGENLIKKISRDLSLEGFSVLTCFHVRTQKGGASEIAKVKLLKEVKESPSSIMDFSECLSGVVPNAIFVWNDSKGSTTIHESRSFHRNTFGDNIMSFNIIFSKDFGDCGLIEKIEENFAFCKNNDMTKCRNKRCEFIAEINTGSREPLIRNKYAFLLVSNAYSGIIRLFKERYKIMIKIRKSQKKLTKNR